MAHVSAFLAANAVPCVEVLTSSGEKGILHVNGKWEFVNLQKAVAAKEIANKLGPEANFAPGNHGNFLAMVTAVFFL